MNTTQEIATTKKINKKAIIISAVALIVILAAALGIYRSATYIDPGEAHKNNSNVSSIGFVIEAEDRIVMSLLYSTFSYSEDAPLPEQGIISTDKNGKDVKILTREYGSSLAYGNGWLYFANVFDQGKLYKVKLDGSEKQLVSDIKADNLICDGDWLYYHNSIEYTIERLNVNSGNTEVLAEKVYVTDINISGDRLYFINGNEVRTVYSMKKDGGNLRETAKIGNGYNLIVNGGYMYYLENGNIYRIKINSKKPEEVITDADISKFVMDDNNIWYLGGKTRYIFRYNLKTKETKQTPVGDCTEIGIANGKAYGIGYDFVFETTIDSSKAYGRYSSLN